MTAACALCLPSYYYWPECYSCSCNNGPCDAVTGSCIISPPASVSYITPVVGPSSGGTLITLIGANFDFQSQYVCNFTNSSVSYFTNAIVGGSSSITCLTPAFNSSTIALVTLSITGAAPSTFVLNSNGISQFTFYAPCSNECSGYGYCIQGVCNCFTSHQGSDCSVLAVAPVIQSLGFNATTAREGSFYTLAIHLIAGTPPIQYVLLNAPDTITLNWNAISPFVATLTWPMTIASSSPYNVSIEAVNFVGLSSVSFLLNVPPSYNATVRVLSPRYGDDYINQIPIGGIALGGYVTYFSSATSQDLNGLPVVIWVNYHSYQRFYYTLTDNTGAFAITFTPYSTEAGLFTIGARHPNDTGADSQLVQDDFQLLVLTADPVQKTFTVPFASNQTIMIATLTNPSDVDYYGLTMAVTNLDDLIQDGYLYHYQLYTTDEFSHTTTTIPQHSSVTLILTVSFPPSEVYVSAPAVITINTSLNVGVTVYCIMDVQPMFSALSVNPSHSALSVAIDSTAILSLTTINVGSSTSGYLFLQFASLGDGAPRLDLAYTNSTMRMLDQATLTTLQERGIVDSSVSFLHNSSYLTQYVQPYLLASLSPLTTIALSVQIVIDNDVPPHLYTLVAALHDLSSTTATQSVSITMDITATSSSVNNVTFQIEDAVTFFDTTHPYVSGALIRLTSSAFMVFTGLTDLNGTYTFVSIPTDTYTLQVEALEHQPLQTVFILTEYATLQTIFLDNAAVSYEFTVDASLVSDVISVEVNANFDTHVPVPLVTASPDFIYWDELESGSVSSINFTVTNHGLVEALDVTLYLIDPIIQFTWLVNPLAVLPANSSMLMPVFLTVLSSGSSGRRLLQTTGSSNKAAGGTATYPCPQTPIQTIQIGSANNALSTVQPSQSSADNEDDDDMDDLDNDWLSPTFLGKPAVSDANSGYPDLNNQDPDDEDDDGITTSDIPYQRSGLLGCAFGCAPIIGGGLATITQILCSDGSSSSFSSGSSSPSQSVSTPQACDTSTCLKSLGLCVVAAAVSAVSIVSKLKNTLLALGQNPTTLGAVKETIYSAISRLDFIAANLLNPPNLYKYHTAYDWKQLLETIINDFQLVLPLLAIIFPEASVLEFLSQPIIGFGLTAANCLFKYYLCLHCDLPPDDVLAPYTRHLLQTSSSLQSLPVDYSAVDTLITNLTSQYVQEVNANSVTDPTLISAADAVGLSLIKLFNLYYSIAVIYGGDLSLQFVDLSQNDFQNNYQLYQTDTSDMGTLISMTEYNTLFANTSLYSDDQVDSLQHLVIRTNRTTYYYSLGIYTLNDAQIRFNQTLPLPTLDWYMNNPFTVYPPAEYSQFDFVYDDQLTRLLPLVGAEYNDTINRGYGTVWDEVESTSNSYDIALSVQQAAVCASLSITLTKQTLTATLEDFIATLTVDNAQQTNLTNFYIAILIFGLNDTTNDTSTSLFDITLDSASGLFGGINGSGVISSMSSATMQWTILPLIGAAPASVAVVYQVAAQMFYSQDGIAYSVPLLPVAIVVHPPPQLQLHYFTPVIVYGDDPFTAIVEPSVSFAVGLLLNNVGFGPCLSLSLASSAPVIRENDRGLLVSFSLLSVVLNGSLQPSAGSLTAGTIEPQSVLDYRDIFKCSLMGTFLNYSVTFSESLASGDRRLSIVSALSRHNLFQAVYIPSLNNQVAYFADDQLDPSQPLTDPFSIPVPDTLWTTSHSGTVISTSVAAMIDNASCVWSADITNMTLTVTVPTQQTSSAYFRCSPPIFASTIILDGIYGLPEQWRLIAAQAITHFPFVSIPVMNDSTAAGNVWFTHRNVYLDNLPTLDETYVHIFDAQQSSGMQNQTYQLIFALEPTPLITNNTVTNNNISNSSSSSSSNSISIRSSSSSSSSNSVLANVSSSITAQNNLFASSSLSSSIASASSSITSASSSLSMTSAAISSGTGDSAITTPVSSTGVRAGILGDPQFSGLRGQKFQIHGIDGAVYNLISDQNVTQVNAQFNVLDGPRSCPVMPSTSKPSRSCWTHRGTYITKVGVQTANDQQLLIESGPATVGFASVAVDGRRLDVGDDILLVRYETTHELTVFAGVWFIELENIDGFLNFRSVRVRQDLNRMTSHGLLGQTWNTKIYKFGHIKYIEGEVDDYVISDGSLFSNDFVYNQF